MATKLEVMQYLANGKNPMSKYGRSESIDFLIGYGCGKCLSPQYIAALIDECSKSVDMNNSDAVLDWIVERECD